MSAASEKAMEKSPAKLPQTNDFSERAIRKIGSKPLNLQNYFGAG